MLKRKHPISLAHLTDHPVDLMQTLLHSPTPLLKHNINANFFPAASKLKKAFLMPLPSILSFKWQKTQAWKGLWFVPLIAGMYHWTSVQNVEMHQSLWIYFPIACAYGIRATLFWYVYRKKKKKNQAVSSKFNYHGLILKWASL